MAESLSGPNKTSAEALSGMWSGPSNLLQPASYVHPFCREVTALKKWIQTSYLSTVMMGCPVFKDDTPFAPLDTLFSNPHEAPMIVEYPVPTGDPLREAVTTKDALKYILPACGPTGSSRARGSS